MATKKEMADRIVALEEELATARQGVLAEIGRKLPLPDARKFLAGLSPRMESKEEMILLVRALSRIEV